MAYTLNAFPLSLQWKHGEVPFQIEWSSQQMNALLLRDWPGFLPISTIACGSGKPWCSCGCLTPPYLTPSYRTGRLIEKHGGRRPENSDHDHGPGDRQRGTVCGCGLPHRKIDRREPYQRGQQGADHRGEKSRLSFYRVYLILFERYGGHPVV